MSEEWRPKLQQTLSTKLCFIFVLKFFLSVVFFIFVAGSCYPLAKVQNQSV